jgi:ParB family transcriptional regulator, chromosome partitioning protein
MTNTNKPGGPPRRFSGPSLLEQSRAVKVPEPNETTAEPGSSPEPALASSGPTRGADFMGSRLNERGMTQMVTREAIIAVDPKRCRPWAHHNRHASWYTPARCADLIASIPKNGQKVPAWARPVAGDPNFDYEIISGMRRCYACAVTNRQLNIVLVKWDDQTAAMNMHLENADRKDISPMERAVSYFEHIQKKLFATQEELASSLNVPQGTLSKMLKAAEMLEQPTLKKLFPDPAEVPLEPAYKLATIMADTTTRTLVLKAADNLVKSDAMKSKSAASRLTVLLQAPERSSKSQAFKETFNLGNKHGVTVNRNPRGKITFAFPKGLGDSKEELVAAVSKIYDQLKEPR